MPLQEARIVEGQYGDLRKRLLAASRILAHQRSILQEWRQAVLEGGDEESLLAESPRWRRLRSTVRISCTASKGASR